MVGIDGREGDKRDSASRRFEKERERTMQFSPLRRPFRSPREARQPPYSHVEGAYL